MTSLVNQKKTTAPNSWAQIKQGAWIKESIQLRLDECYPKLFGYHLLKVGGLSSELSSQQCNIQHQVHLDIHPSFADLIADAHALPFLEKSIDAVILAHQLDFAIQPQQILREVDRVLVDDGYVIITGFNPCSLNLLAHAMQHNCLNFMEKIHNKQNNKVDFRLGEHWLTPTRLDDWLSLLNYQIIHFHTYACLGFSSGRASWAWLEQSLGEKHGLGRLYFIVARKRRYPLRPIKIQWRIRKLTHLGVSYRTAKPLYYHIPND